MTTFLAIFLSMAAAGAGADPAAADEDRPCVLIVVGAPGEPEYAAQFRQWADRWKSAAAKGGAETIIVGMDGDGGGDRERLRAALAAKATTASAGGPSGEKEKEKEKERAALWVVLIGHGTFDGREAKFNLRGPDVTDADLAGWLAPIRRPIAVIDCASASGPFLNRLSGENRVVVVATKSGFELNFARLGQYLAEAIDDPGADLDKDGQVSLLEAFLTAGGRVNEYYRTHAQLATEHALIDDNGDRLGTPPDWFRGVRAVRRARDGAAPDGLRAHQLHLVLGDRDRGLSPEARRRRDRIELAIAALRDEKAKLGEDAYYEKLEPLMVELARLYRDAPPASGDGGHRH